jgi:DNA-binding MarR family transcriptional regulator
VYRLLRDLEEAGYVESEEVTEDSRTRQVYSLTDDGTERLAAYRELPAPFKEWLSGLFGLGNGRSPDPEAGASAEATEGGAGAGRGEEAWVEARLEDLPAEATVQARHAEYGLERSPGEGRWRFVVDRHDPGDYEGADVCPLSFVYMAIQRLLYEKRP